MKTLLLIFFITLPYNISYAEVAQFEREALIKLYEYTDGVKWKSSKRWLGAKGTECDWYGVKCDETSNTITEINLPSNNLKGAIPASLGDLPSLKKLDLSSNKLRDSIPGELGTLTYLNNLNLSKNQLTSTIPPEIGDLTELKHLKLNDNQLTGSIPPELGNLLHIEELNLSYNQLSGRYPVELNKLTTLFNFSFSNNMIKGTIKIKKKKKTTNMIETKTATILSDNTVITKKPFEPTSKVITSFNTGDSIKIANAKKLTTATKKEQIAYAVYVNSEKIGWVNAKAIFIPTKDEKKNKKIETLDFLIRAAKNPNSRSWAAKKLIYRMPARDTTKVFEFWITIIKLNILNEKELELLRDEVEIRVEKDINAVKTFKETFFSRISKHTFEVLLQAECNSIFTIKKFYWTYLKEIAKVDNSKAYLLGKKCMVKKTEVH